MSASIQRLWLPFEYYQKERETKTAANIIADIPSKHTSQHISQTGNRTSSVIPELLLVYVVSRDCICL